MLRQLSAAVARHLLQPLMSSRNKEDQASFLMSFLFT